MSHGTTVPAKLDNKSSEELKNIFLASSFETFDDGSSLDATVLMMDFSYLKAMGKTYKKSPQEIKTMASKLQFSATIDYSTSYIFTGSDQAGALEIKNWQIMLTDSEGNARMPFKVQFNSPLLQKKAKATLHNVLPVEGGFAAGNVEATMHYDYSYSGHFAFYYEVPENCSWIEIKFTQPRTGHWVSVMWEIEN